MATITSRLALSVLALALAGAAFAPGVTSADAGPARITKLSGTDLGSGR